VDVRSREKEIRKEGMKFFAARRRKKRSFISQDGNGALPANTDHQDKKAVVSGEGDQRLTGRTLKPRVRLNRSIRLKALKEGRGKSDHVKLAPTR